jgi:Na+/melibiose symporter-like transporter
MPYVLILYFCVAALIGLLGKNRKLGFWGYFIASILLTPIIGLLLVVASTHKQPVEDEHGK